jgi:tRNA(Ile)-lysidine synthase
MQLLRERFVTHLRVQKWENIVQEGVVLAVSGGLDSMVLLHLLLSIRAKVTVAHCNFQLRGAASDGDALFVEQICTTAGIPFYAQSFETKTYADQNGLSTQMAARQLRYNWFETILEKTEIHYLLTAHHANDNTETILINLLRGTGIKGLSGIPPEYALRNGHFQVLRPLLPFSRAELAIYAQENGIQWREDSSNETDDYLRNFLRHQVVPKLETAQPALLQTMHRSAQYIRDTDKNYQYLLTQHLKFQAVENQSFIIDLASIKALPSPAAALRELLRPYQFTSEQARQIADNLDQVGMDMYSETQARLLIDRKHLVLTLNGTTVAADIRISADDLMVKIPNFGRLFFTETSLQPPYPDGNSAILIDRASLQFPLLLRIWLPGDTFQPFGMHGQHQKVQDFLTNQKVSRLDKEQVRILLNGDGTPIWILGWRLDERFRVTNPDKNGLKITLIR